MFEIVDYRYEWCETFGWLIICMVHCETREHFYVKHMVTSKKQAEQWLTFWRGYRATYFEVTYVNPN